MNLPTANRTDAARNPAWTAYVLPMVVFLLFTLAENRTAGQGAAAVYVVKVCAVTAALYVCRSTWRDINVSARVIVPAALVGVVVFVLWALLDENIGYYRLGSRSAVNPFESLPNPALRTLFLAARFYGLVIMVPLMEELFWRSFLLRYFTNPKIERVPQGAFSWGAFAVVAAGFALSHPEWLPALVAACAYALLLKKSGSIFACVVAHAVTNLALGVYILLTGRWHLW